ncbi:MAG: DUF302 domain-containing protein [Alphaproteobacteria bacterium]|nr:DUF302 domain-containing protein [Alphaproteobacteria bacterium]
MKQPQAEAAGLRRIVRFYLVVVSAALLGVSLTVAAPAVAQTSGFVKTESHHSFAATVKALDEAVNGNQMMVMGRINQAKVLSMTGLKLEGAQSILVGNPQMGKKAFGMDPAAGVVLPARIYVWADHGKTYVGYFAPSSQLAQISPGFSMMSGMLDQKFAMIVKRATQ